MKRITKIEAQLAEKDKLIQRQVFALAETEALEMAHGERIEKLTKLLLLAKDALQSELKAFGIVPVQLAHTKTQEALSAINDSKLVEGLILCDAEPVAKLVNDRYGNFVQIQWREGYFGEAGGSFHLPATPRRTEK